ncbi:MAG: ABC transporter permease [Tissierella sp.]|nr:ABC transporter permease [Tissierella sp.]
MKNPIIKSIIRRPMKFVLLILILSLVSGAFIMNFTSYAIVSKEVESAKEVYHSIGYIQMDLSDRKSTGNVYEIREMLKDEPMIAYEDPNIYALGVSDHLLNSDYNVFTETYNELSGNHFFVRDLFVIVQPENIRTIIPAKDRYDGVTLESRVQKLLGGYPDWIYMKDGTMFKDGFFKVAAPKYEMLTTNLIPYMDDIIIDELYALEIGANYLFRCEPNRVADESSYTLKPLYDSGPLYEKIDNIDEFDLDDPKWQKMREDMELLDINTRSFNMNATKSMETLPRTQESFGDYTLFDGRWLNYDDHKNINKVCVVGKHFFEVRKLKLGDKIPIQYMESEISYYLMTEKDRKEWKNYHKSDVIEYEIVGVYDAYSSGRNIYIPTSTVPEEFLKFLVEDGMSYLFGQNYNFVLNNPVEQSQFIEKYREPIREAGYELQFIDNNAETFWVSTKQVLDNLKTNIILYGILLLSVLLFIIYMYMGIYKNSYAIERILGVTHKSAARHLWMPLYIFSTLGVGVSAYIGYQTAIANSQRILEEILGELPSNLDSSISVKFVFIIFLIIIGLLMIQSLFMMSKLKNKSLLEFFSKGIKKKEKNLDKVDLNRIDLDIPDNEFCTDDLAETLSFDDSSIHLSKGKTALKEYGKKYISRSIVTTTLKVVVTGLLIGTLIYLINVIESNKTFIEKNISETRIVGELAYIGEVEMSDNGSIYEDILNKTLETGLVEDYFGLVLNEYDEMNIDRYGTKETIRKEDILNLEYYERNPNMTIVASNQELNSDSGIKLYGVENQGILDEFNSYNSTKDEIPILASTVTMETYDLEIGHKVALKEWGSIYTAVYGTIIGTFESYAYPTYDETQIQGLSRTSKYEIFIYPIEAVRMIGSSNLYYEEINLLFDQEKNEELYYNREEILNHISKNKYDYSTGYKLVLHDDILTETIEPLEKNLELLNIIYPILLGLSLITAVALPYLLILRRSEELAIMRILGVKKSEVKRYVFTESLSLVIIGQVFAIAVISVVTFKSGIYPIWKYLFITTGYLIASMIGVLASLKNVLDKKPLEMLQVKE